MAKKAEKVEPKFDAEQIRDISVSIYKARLEQSCRGDAARMLEKDGDGGKKLRGRAVIYDQLTRLYLDLFGFSPGGLPIKDLVP